MIEDSNTPKTTASSSKTKNYQSVSNSLQGRVYKPGNMITNRYEISRELGSGGMGAVYQVIDHSLDKEIVALKVLYPQHVLDKTASARFRNEVLIARRLAHPNITRIYDFGEDSSGLAYLTMEYVEGLSLGRYIYAPQHEGLAFADILKVIYEVVCGVEHAHSQGVIHRDLKPDNILVSVAREIKVTDFGLARSLKVDKGFTQTGEAVGTPYYMSPEQLRGDTLDPRCDIYALGIIAYEVACRRRPFQDDTYLQLAAMHMKSPMPKVCKLNSEIPSWYDEFVQICGEKKPEDRFQSMAEVKEFLELNRSNIRNAKSNTAAISSALEGARARKRSRDKGKNAKKRKRLKFLGSLLVFLVTALCTVFSLKENRLINYHASALVIKLEKNSGLKLAKLKKFLGAEIELDLKDFRTAVKNNDSKSLEVLLIAGMSPDQSSISGDTLLYTAIIAGNTSVAEVLIDYGTDLQQVSDEGLTPLILAAAGGHQKILKKIIASGADLNIADNNGKTALLAAVKIQSVPISQSLLSAGADPKPKDREGLDALAHSVRLKNVALSRVLIEGGADLNEQDQNGRTPLMQAAKDGQEELVRLLINAGADHKKRDSRGRTAAQQATPAIRKLIKEKLGKIGQR